ncbi:ABC transporter permease [Pseudoalteromonas sp. MMG007]|uniref:ABC transporter permease n=1 Tax=Pseudoalteromonas sp. MMG007 TaxID=2822684 RepID=UPI001B37B68F|nr:ABC transporter permease [Pseudoalteromonas sp. MMG007]MBQ4859989.1 ABC transporter permease [Pseudoalteromonas sp. MMG007]
MILSIKRLKNAWNALKNKPFYALSIISTMGVSLGALICVLTLSYELLFKPLPYPEPDKIYQVVHRLSSDKDTGEYIAYTYAGLMYLYENQTDYDQGAMIGQGRAILSLHPSQPSLVTGYATPELFPILGAETVSGRLFNNNEEVDSHNPVALISYNTWQNEFDGASDVLDQTLFLNGVNFRIVGVLKDNFVEPELFQRGTETDVWLPWDYNPHSDLRNNWRSIRGTISYIGKGNPGHDINDRLTSLVADKWMESVPIRIANDWRVSLTSVSLKEAIVGGSSGTIMLFLLGVTGVLLIVVINLVNIFISRTSELEKQLAIRAAVGASPKDLFQLLLNESGLLMGISIIVCLLIASFGFGFLKTEMATYLPRMGELSVNLLSLLLAFVFSAIFAFFFAWLSSKFVDYDNLKLSLESSGKGTSVQVSPIVRKTLIGVQVGVVVSLIFVNSILLYKAMQEVFENRGIKFERLHRIELSDLSQTDWSIEGIDSFRRQLSEKLTDLSEVEHVSYSATPLDVHGYRRVIDVSSQEFFTPEVIGIDDQYFTTINQELLTGEVLSKDDYLQQNNYVVINDVFAERLASDGDVIGRQISLGSEIYLVKGVVKKASIPGDYEFVLRMYLPNPDFDVLMVSMSEDGLLTKEKIIDIVKGIDSRISVSEWNSLRNIERELLAPQYVTASMSAFLVVLSVVIGAVGLYGVMAYSTQVRRGEIGTRMAVGASPREIFFLFLKEYSDSAYNGILTAAFVISMLMILYSEKIDEYLDTYLLGLSVGAFSLVMAMLGTATLIPLSRLTFKPIVGLLSSKE